MLKSLSHFVLRGRTLPRRIGMLTSATLLVLAGFACSATFIAGCGGGGGGGSSSGGGNATSGYANRTYSATNLVEPGVGTGSLSLTVSSDSQTVKGTYTLALSEASLEAAQGRAKRAASPLPASKAAVAAPKRQIRAASTTITGSFSGALDPTTGDFSVSGAYNDGLGETVPFTLTGTLPTPPASVGGSVTIAVDDLDSFKTSFGNSPAVTVVTGATPTPSPTPGVALYTAADIGSPGSGYTVGGPTDSDGNTYFGTASINASGQVASTWVDARSANHAFLYTPGAGFTDLGMAEGAGNAVAAGINDSGEIVGASDYQAFIYSNASLQSLVALKADYAAAVNDAGQIVGTFQSSTYYDHAFLYTNGVLKDLGILPGGLTSRANAVNSSGQVAGRSDVGNSGQHAILFANGTLQDLGTFAGATKDESAAYGINSSGHVVGYSCDSGGRYHSFLYVNGSLLNLDTLAANAADFSYASSINDSGQIVGYCSATSSGEDGAFVYTDGVVQNLNGITSGLNGVILINALAIVNNGTILAEGTDSSGGYHLMVLTPVSAETRAAHPLRVEAAHANGVKLDQLPKWFTQRAPYSQMRRK